MSGIGLSCSNGARFLQSETTELPSQPNETDGKSPLRFNSLTLDELSEELERRTNETEKLQEEVENATKCALERFGCIYDISGNNHMCNVDGSSVDSAIIHQQALTQPSIYSQGSSNHRDTSAPGKEVLENALDDSLQQLSAMLINKTCDHHEQEAFSFDNAVVKVQTELQKVQMEWDVLSDLRMTDSMKHVDQMEKMLCLLEELQNIKRSGDQKLQETENETLKLHIKVETLERHIKEFYHMLLSQKKQSGHISLTGPKDAIPTQLSLAAKSIDNLQSKECDGVTKQKERMEQLITSIGQEMAILTDKLSSSNDSSVNLTVKLELLKKLAERQTSLHQHQVDELESTVLGHKDKVCSLGQQLIQAQSQLVDAQREKEQSLRQSVGLQSQLDQVERCGEQQQCELQEEVKILQGQLEVAREQLHRAGEEITYLEALVEEKTQEEEFQRKQQEVKQHLSRFEDGQSQCQTLQAETETLRLKLDDRQKMVEFLSFQMENSTQMISQHSCTIDRLHQENSLLRNQLNQHKLEIKQLRAELDHLKSDLAAAEHERCQLHASVIEQTRRVQEETLEKRQLTIQLEVHRLQLLTLTEDHKELQRLSSCKNEENEGVVLRLESQLKNTQAELDRVRSSLRTLEGADGHGLRVAMGMQKEITARREQTDCLQGRIQHLEESVEKLYQEKCYQNLENQRQIQELAFVREEKRQLAIELETLRSKDKQLKDRINQLEAILHKMSEGFADCQDFIQLKEQEFFSLKLKHALDLKELQGQNVHTALNVTPPVLDSSNSSALTDPPSSQHASDTQIKCKKQQESPTRELRSLVKEVQGGISENQRPHTDNPAAGSSIHRRRSAPERVHRTAFAEMAEAVKPASRLRRKTCSSGPHFLKTAELPGKMKSNNFVNESHVISTPAIAARSNFSLHLLSLGRRSPVHALLTSDPYS